MHRERTAKERKDFYMRTLYCEDTNEAIGFYDPLFYDMSSGECLSEEAGERLLFMRVTEDTYDLMEGDDPRYYIHFDSGLELVLYLEEEYWNRQHRAAKERGEMKW
jgi:hypothetical protein